MRIYYFPKLVAETAEEFELKNCSVVIDGQNFLHNKYQSSKIPFTFGGDMDRYATYVHDNLLNMFEKANVKCYFVFKGGDTDINKKIKKFGRFVFDKSVNKAEFLRPILLRDTNVQIVHDTGSQHAFCITESKDDCIALATRLECPVISNDIEYCFRTAPYIPETTLAFDSTTNTIHCRRYTLQNFLKRNKLTESKMVIFRCLSDTAIFPPKFFDELLRSWNVVNESNEEDYYVRNQQLILWLSEHEDQEIRRSISEYLQSEDDRSKFWAAHKSTLLDIPKTEGGFATEYLINSQLDIGVEDPDWFEKGVVCEHIPSMYVNLYKWRVVQGSWFDRQDNNNNDSFLLSIDITKYAYNLLTNYKRATLKLYHDSESYTEIDTVDPCVPRPDYDCQVSVFENGWEDIDRWNLFQHFLQHKGINIEMLSKLPDDSVLLFIALAYFACRKEDVSKETRAIILCYVLLNAQSLLGTDLKEDLKEANRVKGYFESGKRRYVGQVMKNFDEFLFCLQQMNYLNKLCGSPYKETCYSRMCKGTLIYSLFIAMDISLKPCDVFISDSLKYAPSVLTLFNKLIQSYKALLSAAK